MEDIEHYSEEITQFMKEYERLIIESVLYDENRAKWKQSCVEKQRKIKNLILAMKEQMEQLPSTSSSYRGLLKQHQTQLAALYQQFQRKIKAPPKAQTVRKEIPKINEEDNLETNRTVDAYFLRGDKQMARMKDAVQNMNVQLQEAIQLAQQVNIELNRQIQQLDNIGDKVKDTKSTLSRANKTITFFAKAAQCDKCILGLVICIIFAAVAFVALLIRRR